MATTRPPTPDEFRRGYRFWLLIILAILVYEVAGTSESMPWTTISGMVGNLEDKSSNWAIVALAAVAAVAFQALRPESHDHGPLGHSSMGRLSLGEPPENQWAWYGAAFVIGVAVFTELVAIKVMHDRFHRAWAIYGALLVFGIVIPSILSIAGRSEAGFPSLFVTISHLRNRDEWWAGALTVAISGGLAILAIHLAFYPWPDLAKENVKYAGLEAGKVKAQATKHVQDNTLQYSARARGIADGKEAWIVYFLTKDGTDSKCKVTITQVKTASGKKHENFDATAQCNG